MTLNKNSPSNFLPVAQLDRAFGYEPKGQEFESLLGGQFWVCPLGNNGTPPDAWDMQTLSPCPTFFHKKLAMRPSF